MTTNSIILDENWQELAADGEDFAFQNIDASGIALISYSDSAPTGKDNAHRIYKRDKGWLSSYASGKLWGRALVGTCKSVITK